MIVSGAFLARVRFAGLMLMSVVDVRRAKAVIVIGEAVHDPRGVAHGKRGGGG